LNKWLPAIAFLVLLLVPVVAQDAFAAIHIVDLTDLPIPNQNLIGGDTIIWTLNVQFITGCTILPSDTFNVDFFIGGGPNDTLPCISVIYNTPGTAMITGFLWDGVNYIQISPALPVSIFVFVPPLSCGAQTFPNAQNQCVPNLPIICGPGTTPNVITNECDPDVTQAQHDAALDAQAEAESLRDAALAALAEAQAQRDAILATLFEFLRVFGVI